jgi:Sulfotransferase family
MEFTLHSYWPVSYFEVKGFLAWLAKQDRDHAYAYLATLLKYLQWQFHRSSPRPWVLKSPPNLGYEAEMARHLPGARFVMLHRDPVESIPSTVAIVRELRRLYGSGAGDLRQVGAWAMAEYSGALARNMQWRATLPDQAVLDLRYADIRDDYETAVSRVYEFCGMELSATAALRMQAWAGDNEQHKHGVHQYTLDEAGLSEAAIRRQFAPYISAFERYF